MTIITEGNLDENEVRAYEQYVRDKNPEDEVVSLHIKVDGEFVDLDYETRPRQFERIRRITGYLVGTLDRFNDAKYSEVQDRVKHATT